MAGGMILQVRATPGMHSATSSPTGQAARQSLRCARSAGSTKPSRQSCLAAGSTWTTIMADSPSAGAGTLSFPTRPGSPLAAAAKRMLLAAGLLALSAAIVYLDRHGYRDAAHPGRPLSVIGYGDIVPVTTAARLVNTVVITPMRLVFLIILVGATLQVLTGKPAR